MANSRRVSRGLQFIAGKYTEDISVEDVARAAGMSRRGLHQAFLDHVGRTPGDQTPWKRKKALVPAHSPAASGGRVGMD